MTIGKPVEEELSDIWMNTRRVMIHLEYDFEENWLNQLE